MMHAATIEENFISSSLAPANDNLNTLFLYNFIRGRLTNIPSIGTGSLLRLYSGSNTNSGPSGSKLALHDGAVNVTASYVSTGIYSCSIGIKSSSITTLYDVWHKDALQFSTGSIAPLVFNTRPTTKEPVYYTNITNLANLIVRRNSKNELVRQTQNWNPTIYTKATANPETTNIHSASTEL